jgi:hypothetical protein
MDDLTRFFGELGADYLDAPLCGDKDSNAPWKDLRLQFIFSALCHPLL